MLDGLVDDLERPRVLPSVVVVLRQVVQQPQLRSRWLPRSYNFKNVYYNFRIIKNTLY